MALSMEQPATERSSAIDDAQQLLNRHYQNVQTLPNAGQNVTKQLSSDGWLYCYDVDHYRSRYGAVVPQLLPRITPLTSELLPQLVKHRLYLYVVVESGQVLIGQQPLTFNEMLRCKEMVRLVHPMLAHHHGLRVLGAGECMLAQNHTDASVFVFVNNLSGHYFPLAASLNTVAHHFAKALNISSHQLITAGIGVQG
jgi:hypothetical protein